MQPVKKPLKTAIVTLDDETFKTSCTECGLIINIEYKYVNIKTMCPPCRKKKIARVRDKRCWVCNEKYTTTIGHIMRHVCYKPECEAEKRRIFREKRNIVLKKYKKKLRCKKRRDRILARKNKQG